MNSVREEDKKEEYHVFKALNPLTQIDRQEAKKKGM